MWPLGRIFQVFGLVRGLLVAPAGRGTQKKKPKQPVQNGGPLGLSQAVPVQIDTANEGVLAVDVSVCGAKLVGGKDLKAFECEGCRFFKKEPIAEVDHWIQRTEVCRLLQPNEMRTRKK